MSFSEHLHKLSDGQLICDNEECRRKVFNQIKEMKNDFNKIVENNSKNNQINQKQAWKIINLVSKNLSEKLIQISNKQEIEGIIENFIEQNSTKQEFNKIFDDEKQKNLNEFITKEQLWKIYIDMSKNAIALLSKTKQDREKYLANSIVSDEK